jgi:hypothetical protein
MLTVKNNNIYVTRGETSALTYEVVKRSGEPYILAPMIDKSLPVEDRVDYAVLAFTIKTGAFGQIVLAKYLDLESPPMYDGMSDYLPGGWHKFKTQRVQSVSQLSDMTETDLVYKYQDAYYTVILTKHGTRQTVPYRFKILIPFTWKDLEALEPAEYTYDITLYYGKLTAEELAGKNNDFPLEQDARLAKIPLVTPHKFTVGDSNNV